MRIRAFLITSTALSLLICSAASAQQPPQTQPGQPSGPAAKDKDDPKQRPPGQKQPPQAQPGRQAPPPAAQGQPTPPGQARPSTAQEQPKAPLERKELPRKEAQPPAPTPGGPARTQGQPPQAPAAQPPASTAQEKKQLPAPTAQDKQPSAPTAQEKKQELQRPAQTQPGRPQTPAAQGQPPQPQTPAAQQPTQRQQPAQGQPGQPQPPAAQTQPAQPQPPAAQTRPGQPPAAQTPAQPQPPAAQTQPAQPQPPAAQTQPAQPQPPAAQTQPAQPQVPTAQQARPIPPAAQGQPIQLPGTNARRVDELRGERRETREGNRVIIQEADRTIIREGNRTIIRHNEVDRFRYGARDVRMERRGNDNVTIIDRPDGSRIVTVTDANGRLVRRTRRDPAGREIVIIDNPVVAAAAAASYFVDLPPPAIRMPRERYIMEAEGASEADIYETLIAAPVERLQRRYTLDEIRYSPQLRDRMPRVDIDTITFETGSWEVAPDQAARLSTIAAAIKRAVSRNPSEVFLIEGHTDAVGPDDDNLSLSDRRAESVALVLTEQFQVPPENLTSQGYGEQQLKVQTDGPERQNRRVTMRRITPLLGSAPQQPGG